MPRHRVQISARTVLWPQQCACCGNPPEGELRATVNRTTGRRFFSTRKRGWNIPYCAPCLAHIRKHRSAKQAMRTGILVALALWVLPVSPLALGLVATLVLTASIQRFRMLRKEAGGMMIPGQCASPDVAVEYLEWYGILHTFVFASTPYLKAFLDANDMNPELY